MRFQNDKLNKKYSWANLEINGETWIALSDKNDWEKLYTSKAQAEKLAAKLNASGENCEVRANHTSSGGIKVKFNRDAPRCGWHIVSVEVDEVVETVEVETNEAPIKTSLEVKQIISIEVNSLMGGTKPPTTLNPPLTTIYTNWNELNDSIYLAVGMFYKTKTNITINFADGSFTIMDISLVGLNGLGGNFKGRLKELGYIFEFKTIANKVKPQIESETNEVPIVEIISIDINYYTSLNVNSPHYSDNFKTCTSWSQLNGVVASMDKTYAMLDINITINFAEGHTKSVDVDVRNLTTSFQTRMSERLGKGEEVVFVTPTATVNRDFAIKLLEAFNNDDWWLNDNDTALIHKAVKKGWVLSQSVTQAEWTNKAILALRGLLPELKLFPSVPGLKIDDGATEVFAKNVVDFLDNHFKHREYMGNDYYSLLVVNNHEFLFNNNGFVAINACDSRTGQAVFYQDNQTTLAPPIDLTDMSKKVKNVLISLFDFLDDKRTYNNSKNIIKADGLKYDEGEYWGHYSVNGDNCPLPSFVDSSNLKLLLASFVATAIYTFDSQAANEVINNE